MKKNHSVSLCNLCILLMANDQEHLLILPHICFRNGQILNETKKTSNYFHQVYHLFQQCTPSNFLEIFQYPDKTHTFTNIQINT